MQEPYWLPVPVSEMLETRSACECCAVRYSTGSKSKAPILPFPKVNYTCLLEEWADCLTTALQAAREGRPFRMAELGSGPYGIWAIRSLAVRASFYRRQLQHCQASCS